MRSRLPLGALPDAREALERALAQTVRRQGQVVLERLRERTGIALTRDRDGALAPSRSD